MTIKVKQNLVPSSKYNIKCPYSMNAEYITFHNTANDAMAQSEINYMKNNNAEVSYHFAVDDKEVVQGVPTNRNAWHTGDSGKGDGNRKSIGVEVCYSLSGGAKYAAAEKLAIKFIAQLLHERGWGINRVKTHKHWTQVGVKKGYSTYVKNCPHRVLDAGRWNQVLQQIENELSKLKGTKTKPGKVTTPSKPSQNTSKPSTGNLGLVDYLKSKGINSSQANRKKLATQYGVKGYDLSAKKNTELLNAIKKGKPTASKPSTSTSASGSLKSKVNGLRFYNKPSWGDKDVVGTVNKGIGFPTIVKKVKVGTSHQYQVKNSKGATYYITASSKYVTTSGKSTSKPKPKAPSYKVGSKVKIKSTAKKYATGENIPARFKGKSYTIQQVKGNQVLLKEIVSWVYKKDVS